LLQIEPENSRLEIGATWLGRPWRRTALNTEAKLLMLSHVFEVMGCIRVEVQADAENEQSRAAFRQIRACEEGTLRNYRLGADGRPRVIVV
jgi:RimJ/RimL family protein N-acetyltransferase